VKQEWYSTFINELHEKVVYKLLLAANFMHIQPLLDLVVLRIAWLFSKKSPDEVRFLQMTSMVELQKIQDGSPFSLFALFSSRPCSNSKD
jgi:hypothetical protein